MSRYIKKHRRQFMGVALPLFFLFLLGAIGLSVFPGWINSSYSTPGQSCSTDGDCDLCADELCVFNDTISIPQSQCANFPSGLPNFNPATTDTLCPTAEDPTCFDICQVVNTSIIGPVGQCFPDDAFCQGISGGDQANACRTAVCTSTFDNSAPSGCEFDFNTAAVSNEPPACVLCSAPQPPGFTACGNGVCEPGLGETFDNCSVDCRVPGFEGPKLPQGDSTLNGACPQLAAKIDFVTFSGPPFNDPNNDFCEDGDVCTQNTCNPSTGNCDVVDPAPCNPLQADFCCPAGCNPPPTGTSCSPNDLSCDPDCLPPVDCPFCGNNIIDAGEACDGTAANNCGAAGCNNATCQCRPSFIGCLQGDGVFGKESSPGSCDGFSCSLNKDAGMPPAMNLWLFGMMAAGLGLGLCLRRRAE
jgi:hypothetical protein